MLDLRSLLRTRSAYGGQFDAGGRHLVFISDLGGVPQVWGVGDGGWPEQLVAPPDRAQTLHPGPKPGQLIVGADIGGNEHRQLLHVADAGAAWHALTDAPEYIHTFGSWAADGRRVSYAANTRTGRWFDIFVRDLVDTSTRCVLEDDSTNAAGPFSPDGRWLIVSRSFSNARNELWLVDLSDADPPRLLTPLGAEAVFGNPEWTPDGTALYCLTNLGREFSSPARLDVAGGQIDFFLDDRIDVDDTALAPDGTRLAYARNVDGAAEVVVRDLAGGAEQIVAGLPPGALYDYWQGGLAWDHTGQRLAISWTASRANPNVWLWTARESAARQATFAGGLEVELTALVEPEHVTFPSFDGRQIPALFYGTGGGPCVVWVHGGPESQFRPTFQPLVQYLVSAGFSVLAPNVRGSSGYGRTFIHLDDVRKRMDSVADLAHAVYWLRDSGRADPRRIAVYGGSYGGFMVLAALTTYPELWAAGVDLVGIGNFVTFLENTGPWRRHLREAEYGSLANDREFLTEISPINRVERISAPLLVVHGANDPRVPIGEAEQMVGRLRALGRTVEFVRLEDEGHQIAKLANKLHTYPTVARFLGEHVSGRD